MAELDNSVDLDLETLVGVKKNVKMPDGKIIAIAAPDLLDLLKMSKLGQQMQDLDKLSEEETVEVFNTLKSTFVDLIPELQPYRDTLNFQQVLAVLNLVVKLAMPSDLSELEKQGITLDDDQKKALEGFLEQ
jgi:hypothetical protein